MDTSKQKLFDQLKKLDTEQRNPNTMSIDLASSSEIVALINQEDKKVADAVSLKIDEISKAVDIVSDSFHIGGRLLYFGAGTSGRLGVLDAAECPPTFGSDPSQVEGFIAGGKEAMFVAQEGAEDSELVGENDLVGSKASKIDVVCGLAASGRTPYVLGVIKKAKELGISTILITTVPKDQLSVLGDITIDVPVGPEVIMGSTRMKSGSAQKMVLNMITTGAFILQGKILENVMVDLKLTNKKLVERAKRIIMNFGKVDYDTATSFLDKSGSHVKTALVMILSGVDKKEAESLLKTHNGFIRKAIEN
ncbi:MAG: N-acetylmuramic acid 6-phosphate etherase [Balneola sp.]|nr:MAG: N-acetylmuramic acid 6-phosphate etherase [Balneola sp.]